MSIKTKSLGLGLEQMSNQLVGDGGSLGEGRWGIEREVRASHPVVSRRINCRSISMASSLKGNWDCLKEMGDVIEGESQGETVGGNRVDMTQTHCIYK